MHKEDNYIMKFLNHIFNKHRDMALSILAILAFAVLIKVFAATPYAPGVTLDPAEGPGDAFVNIPASQWQDAVNDIFFDAGNVGVGTSTPAARLDVLGESPIFGDAPTAFQVIGGDAAPAFTAGKGGDIILTGGNGGSAPFIGTSGNGGDIALQGGAPGFGGGSPTYGNLTLQATGGNVGIGTDAPAGILDVFASTNKTRLLIDDVAQQISLNGSYNGDNFAQFLLADFSGAVSIGDLNPSQNGVSLVLNDISQIAYIRGTYNLGAASQMFSVDFANGLWKMGDIDNSQNSTLFTLDDLNQKFTFENGNVGIGTATPNNLIQVAGLINFDANTSSTFLGSEAGNLTSTGAENTAVGFNALHANEDGYLNSAFGFNALSANLSGYLNVALGYGSLVSNTTGFYNTVIGSEAGSSNISGSRNVFIGRQAGFYETGDNKLYIANDAAPTLIYGDFSTGQVGIGISSTEPETSALLDLSSITLGFLPPRMSTTQMNAISSPASGLIIYNISINTWCGWNNTATWVRLDDGTICS